MSKKPWLQQTIDFASDRNEQARSTWREWLQDGAQLDLFSRVIRSAVQLVLPLVGGFAPPTKPAESHNCKRMNWVQRMVARLFRLC